jgi:two-component system sensor histidine kinase YesM
VEASMWNIFGIKRIRYKLIFVFLLLTLTIIVTVLLITYYSSTDIIKNQSIELNNKLLELGKNNLENSIDEVDKIFHSLYINEDFKKFISTNDISDDFNFISTYTRIKNTLHSIVNSRRDIYSIIYVDKKGYYIYTTRTEAGYSRTFNIDHMPDWFRNSLQYLQDQKNGKMLLPTHEHIPLEMKVTDKGEKVYTMARSIINVDKDYEVLGTLFINLDLTTLQKISSEIIPYKNSFTYIVSPDGTVVYDSKQRNTGENIKDPAVRDLHDKVPGNMQISIDGRQWMAVYTTSDVTGWKIINFIPMSEYTANISFFTKMMLTVLIMAGLFSILIAFIVSRYISTPIESLSGVMQRMDIDKMDLRADESGRDEIGSLAKSFNSLIDKLQNSIENEYEANIRQKEAEMKALQSQINPHFLNNVLQSISSIAVLNHVESINIMAKSLGKIMRYNMKTNENVVTVREECEHVMNYLSIQKIRFGDKLEYELNCPPYLNEYPILKFTLQPIVENAIIHGFEHKTDKGIINIQCSLDGDYIVFDIADNGYGMDETRMEYILSGNANGIGLNNVITRLKLFYHNKAVLSIEGEIHVGTNVRIKIPINIERKNAGDQDSDRGR